MRVNLGVGQWVGCVLILAVCAVMGVLLPSYGDKVAREAAADVAAPAVAVDAGERIAEGDVSVVPGDGWSQAAADGVLSLSRNNVQFVVSEPVDAGDESMVDQVEAVGQAFTADKSLHFTLGEPKEFTTSSGLEGASLQIAGPSSISLQFAVTDGTQVVTGAFLGDSGSWSSVSQDLQPMLESIEIGDATTGGQ